MYEKNNSRLENAYFRASTIKFRIINDKIHTIPSRRIRSTERIRHMYQETHHYSTRNGFCCLHGQAVMIGSDWKVKKIA